MACAPEWDSMSQEFAAMVQSNEGFQVAVWAFLKSFNRLKGNPSMMQSLTWAKRCRTAHLRCPGVPSSTAPNPPYSFLLHISSLLVTSLVVQLTHFLGQLKKFNLPKTMMVHFYTSIITSILTSSITIWDAAATTKDKGRVQHIIRSAERVTGCNLPSLHELHASRTLKRAGKIVVEPSHPGHILFQTLPSGRRLRSIRTITSSRLSFIWVEEKC